MMKFLSVFVTLLMISILTFVPPAVAKNHHAHHKNNHHHSKSHHGAKHANHHAKVARKKPHHPPKHHNPGPPKHANNGGNHHNNGGGHGNGGKAHNPGGKHHQVKVGGGGNANHHPSHENRHSRHAAPRNTAPTHSPDNIQTPVNTNKNGSQDCTVIKEVKVIDRKSPPIHLSTPAAVGLGTLTIIILCVLLLLALYGGYMLGYKDSDRQNARFLRALRDQISPRAKP